ncbi:hypothetical protein GCM10009841_26910 [Microlunatus panaciterrae]
MLSAAAAVGPVWVVRSGVVLAVIAGIVACGYAWRELAQSRRDQAEKLLRVTKDHGAALSAERRHNGAVVQTLAQRATAACNEVERLRITIAELQTTISSLNGDKAFLTGEIRERETAIASLEQSLRSREAELAALQDDDAEVHAMPRRVLSEHRTGRAVEADRSVDADPSTVVDLKTMATAMAMPNYEEDRRQA